MISDEIYAGSVYKSLREDEKSPTFVSAMALASSSASQDSESEPEQDGLGLGPYIHLVYALSKDFALSGLRVGVAYTENEELLTPFQKLNDLCQISSQTQLLVERMLSAEVIGADADAGAGADAATKRKKFYQVYLESNASNIQSRCDTLQACLDRCGVPYLNADSGLFVWMDFREFLPSIDMQDPANTASPDGDKEEESLASKESRERQLYLQLMKEYGLLVTPGMSMRNECAGFFRCVFTAASDEEFELGLSRICRFVNERRMK